MKTTKWQVLFFICQMICMFFVPVLLLWLEYGDSAYIIVTDYKLSVTGVAFVLFFFVLSKRFWLNDILQKMQLKIANIETDALSMTDPNVIRKSKRKYLLFRYIDLAFKLIIPAVILVGLLFVIHALEQQVIKMFAVMFWSTLSFVAGVIFKVLEIKSTRFVHEGEKKK